MTSTRVALVVTLLLASSPAFAQRASEVFGNEPIAAPAGSIPYLRRLPTDAEIEEVTKTAPELQSVAASAAVDCGPGCFRGATPAMRVEDVRVEKWHMPGVKGPTSGSFALVKLTAVLARADGRDGTSMAQAVFLGYRTKDGKLGVLSGYIPGDKPGQYFAPPIVQGRTPEERDRQLAQVIAGAQAGFAGGPERVVITVASAAVNGGSVEVSGSIESATPITSTLFMRVEGGEVKQGHVGAAAGPFHASCERVAGVGNVFKLTADNEAGLGAEVTLAFDASGRFLGLHTTSTEGDVTVEGRPPAGLGGAGSVPGPATAGQAAAGILTPALLGLLLHGLLGGSGGGSGPPPPKPTGRGRTHRGTGEGAAPDVEPEGDDSGTGADAEGEGDGAGGKGGVAKGRHGKPTAGREGGTGGASTPPPAGAHGGAASQPAAPKPAAAAAGPAAPALAGPERDALDQLGRLENRARFSHSDVLTKALADARASCVRPDGSIDLDRWKASSGAIRDAFGAYGREGAEPNSYVGDVVREVGYAPVEAIGKAGSTAAGLVRGIGGLAVSGVKGIGSIVEGILHPGYFATGAKAKVNEWVAKNCPGESKALRDAMMDGRPLDALASMARTAGTAGGQLLSAAAHFMKSEVLPVDEIQSLFGKDSSLEERLWAVPAAATKIAGLLLGGATPTAVPSTRIGAALGRTADAIGKAAESRAYAAAEGAAARKAAQLQAQVASLEKSAAVRAARGEAGGVGAVLDKTRDALEAARAAEKAAAATRRVEALVPKAVGEGPIQNLRDAMRRLDDNPELRRAADDAIRANGGGSSLYGLRVEGTMSKDAHTVLTARKLQLQEEAMNNATRRILQEEVDARLAVGRDVPTRFDTFNASQGSRSRISGANVNADYDQTLMGIEYVRADRSRQILGEECGRLGQTQSSLDVNVYQPRRGIADAGGAAPNSQAALENIGQTTGSAGHHQVHVTSDRVVVGDHVTTAQGREGVLAGRRTMDPPPGMSAEQWQSEGVWEGHQGRPIQVPREQWPEVRQAQLDGLQHAADKGEMNQMVKYANRARSVGLPVSESTERLLRAVAGEKDPLLARQILQDAGIDVPADLMQRLGLS